MAYNNFGYTGYIPSNVSVEDNINQALQYQATHNEWDTLMWFKDMVQNHGDWDYKQQSGSYEDFGNFNYGAVGAALGYPDFVLQSAAGGAQLASLFGGTVYEWAAVDWIASWHPFVDSGFHDDPNDQAWINEGINAARKYGFGHFYSGNISDNVNSLWHAFKNWVAPRRDPLVLDLDGDGIETLGVNATTHVVFDYDGDGVKTGTGWIKGDDGFVVLDRNGNGTIDNGGELFGDQTLVNGAKASDGFAALSAEDTNHNGKFDAGDTNFTKVRIWQDTNSDGISQAGELHTLSELGITSINLTSTTSNTVSNGNVQIAKGTYTKTNGTTGDSGTLNLTEDTGAAGNLNFSQNPFYSEFTDYLTLTDTALALPDMQGSGMVRDLREASTLSVGLTSTLQSMKDEGYVTHDTLMAQVDTLLVQWAGTSTMTTSVQREAAINGKTLVYLPTQNSSDFNLYYKMLGYLDPNTTSGFSALASEAEIQRYNYLLSEQTRITNMISVLERFNGETFVTIEPDKLTASGGTLTATLTSSSTSGSGIIMVDPRVFVGLSAAQVSFLDQSYAQLKQSVYDGLVLQTRLSGYMDALNLTIDANGIHIDDSAMMGIISDKLLTSPANAVRDIIELRKYAGSSLGTLGWNADGALSHFLAQTDGLYDPSSVFAEYGMNIADGTYTGTAGNDYVWGKQRDDIINSGDGNDILYGGDGNDVLNGSFGSDTLSGGTGNDILEGGYDNDTYIFNRGDGQDIIYDGYYRRGSSNATTNNYYDAGNDTIQFGSGISASDITAKVDGNNLILALKEDGKTFDQLSNKITIENWYNMVNRIENIKFVDGTTLNTNSTILSLLATDGDDTINSTEAVLTIDAKGGNDTINAMNYANNTIHGGDGNDTINTYYGINTLYGDAGNDTINGGYQGDTLYGGDGNDVLNGSFGSDTLSGGTGNDILEGGYDNDTYIFNRGDGQDIIYDGYYRRGSSNATTNNYYDAGNDTIQFGSGISASDVAFYFNGASLCIGYGSGDAITIENQRNNNNAIEKFTLSDGNYLTSNDINVIIQSMNAYATDHGMSITSLDSVKANQDLMNIIATGWHK